MTDALARLLDGIIDYAGLFPPAKLPMGESVDHYLRYRSGPESWIMDRFVCASSRLGELAEDLKGRQVDEPIAVSVIGKAPASAEDWGDSLVHDAEAMTRFIERMKDAADVEGYEIRIPDHAGIDDYLRDLRSFSQVEVFCELPLGEGLSDSLGAIAEQEWLGAKARTGGLEPAAYPSPDSLSEFLQQCQQLDVKYKLTAGLHHPFRRGHEHGFLNAAVAVTLLQAHDLSRKEVAAILADEDASAFVFSGEKLAYKDLDATVEDIDDARGLFVSYGCCSIDEPLTDLRDSGLC